MPPKKRNCLDCGNECYGRICKNCYCKDKFKGKVSRAINRKAKRKALKTKI